VVTHRVHRRSRRGATGRGGGGIRRMARCRLTRSVSPPRWLRSAVLGRLGRALL